MSSVLHVLIFIALMGAVFLLVVGFLPFDFLRDRAESLVPGRSLALTAERFSGLRAGCRMSAAMLVFMGAVLLSYRSGIPQFWRELLAECDWRETAKNIWLRVSDPWTLWPFLAIFLAGAAFRLLEISRPIRLDEAFAYFSYWDHPPYWAISDYSSSNNHLFHSLLATCSRIMFGSGPIALRLPALIGGLLMLPAALAAGEALYGRSAGIVAMALTASAPPFIDYSALAKGYSWQCLLTLLAVVFASRVAEKQARHAHWLGFVICSTLAMWTIPTSILAVTSVIIWILGVAWMREGPEEFVVFTRRLLPALLAVTVLTMLCYMPALIVSGPAAIFANRFVLPMAPAEFAALTPGLLVSTWTRWNEGVPLACRLFVYAGLCVGLAMHRRIGRQPLPFAPVMVLLCAAFIVARRVHIYSRVWLFVWLFFLITAAAGIAFLLVRRPLAAVFAVVLTLTAGPMVHRNHTVLWSMENGNVQGLDQAVTWMAHNLSPNDRIIGSGLAGPPLDYILRQEWPALEPQVECVTSGLPMCGSRAIEKGPLPERLIALIAKQPAVDDGHATNPDSWANAEDTPQALMFARHDRGRYSEPRVLHDQTGVTIWASDLHPDGALRGQAGAGR